MYAIIETGGKQYTVKSGDVIDIELVDSISKDNTVKFSNVLFFHNGSVAKMGAPHVAGCVVSGELLEEIRGPKTINYKYKKRKNYRRKVGHRQDYHRIKITELKG